MAFPLVLSAVLLVFGLWLLWRAILARRAAGESLRISPWFTALVGLGLAVGLFVAGRRLLSLAFLPLLLPALGALVRPPWRGVFWIVLYFIRRGFSQASPQRLVRRRARTATRYILRPREARRILGLGAEADAQTIRARAGELLQTAAHPERAGWTHDEPNTTNLVFLKVLEAREVLLEELARRGDSTDGDTNTDNDNAPPRA